MVMPYIPDEYEYPVEPEPDVPVALVPAWASTPFERQLQDIRHAAAMQDPPPGVRVLRESRCNYRWGCGEVQKEEAKKNAGA